MNWGSVLKKHELWRIVTTFFCFGGKFGVNTVLDLIILMQVRLSVESFARLPSRCHPCHDKAGAFVCCHG